MNEKRKKKTVTIPDGTEKTSRDPLIAFLDLHGGDGNERDPSKPIAFDEHGNPLYAPRGITYRIPWR